MSPLTIELVKQVSGGSVLKCVRADGSVTWQRNEGSRARFFPLHDLTHYAVESVLGAADGFYGLIARGWEMTDTTGLGARGGLPDATIAIEHLVGLLDAERASGTTITAVEVNKYSAEFAQQQQRSGLPHLSDEILDRIRAEVARLHAAWTALKPGETMTLLFSLPSSP
ncbi:MAG: hypothetical protein M3Y69_01790 [Verrucomicrobiota bacterium]|nr:hypothetical protein [Verrucomicrobiota bacterium]